MIKALRDAVPLKRETVSHDFRFYSDVSSLLRLERGDIRPDSRKKLIRIVAKLTEGRRIDRIATTERILRCYKFKELTEQDVKDYDLMNSFSSPLSWSRFPAELRSIREGPEPLIIIPSRLPRKPAIDVEASRLPLPNEIVGEHIRACPYAIYAFDFYGIVRIWNPAAEQLFGWSEQEIINQRLPFVSEYMSEEFLRRLQVCREDNAILIGPSPCRKDGVAIEVIRMGCQLYGRNDSVVGHITIAAKDADQNVPEEYRDAYVAETQRRMEYILVYASRYRPEERI